MDAQSPNPGLPLEWITRAEPLPPAAVAAQGEAARRLARRLLWLDDDQLPQLRGICARDALLILGPAEILPWSPGVMYLGHEKEAALLLLPTTHGPNVPPALLEKALVSRFPALQPPLAVLPGSRQVLSTQGAQAIERGLLQAWLRGDG